MVVRNKSTLQTKFALGVVPVLEAIGFKRLKNSLDLCQCSGIRIFVLF
jgi:hypothetical protein